VYRFSRKKFPEIFCTPENALPGFSLEPRMFSGNLFFQATEFFKKNFGNDEA